MGITFREMRIEDFPPVIQLWQNTEGIGLSSSDSKENFEYFLGRNPNLSFIVLDGKCLAGAVMCGHDGRRGFIYHLAVDKKYRHQGVGRKLVEYCLNGLKKVKIEKCHVMVLEFNENGQKFWQKMGWEERTDIKMMSRAI